MRRILIPLCLVSFWLGVPAFGQSEPTEKDRYVVIPSEFALPVIASQPGCPLQFENARYLVRIGGGGGAADFQLRNRGTKPIRSIGYAVWFSNGTGWASAWPKQITTDVVMPGQLVPFPNDDQDEILPLTDELRDKLKLRGPMKMVIVFMILRVEFTDGTTFKDDSTFNALEKYFEKVGEAVDP